MNIRRLPAEELKMWTQTLCKRYTKRVVGKQLHFHNICYGALRTNAIYCMRMSVSDNPFCLVTDEAGGIMYFTDRMEGQMLDSLIGSRIKTESLVCFRVYNIRLPISR